MKMGFSAAVLTPPLPCQMAGYAVPREAQGVHDDLYARVLAFQEGSRPPVVIAGLDLLNLDELTQRAVTQLLRPLGIESDRLLVCCTHTHAAFGGIFDMESGINAAMPDLLGEARPDLVEWVAARLEKAAAEALSDMADVSVSMNRDTMSGQLATNRHAPDAPSDQDILTMDFLRADGKRVLLYNLNCHPTVLNAENRLLSADFAGGVAARLSADYDMTLFVNGSAGDMSTRFTRRESSFAECARFADIVAGKIRRMREKSAFAPLTELSLAYRELLLETAEVDAPDTAQERYAAARRALLDVQARTSDRAQLRKAESLVEGAQVNLLKSRHMKRHGPEKAAVRAGLLSVNGRKVVCSPLELFSTLALRLKQQADADLFGYANALMGYLADGDAFDAGDYEALMSVFAKGAGEQYVDLLAAWLA